MREARVEEHLRREVEKRGGRCMKFVSPGRRHVPDRLVLWPLSLPPSWPSDKGSPARAHFVEVKAPGEKPRPGQQREHARLRKMGFEVFVLDSKPKVNSYIRRHA